MKSLIIEKLNKKEKILFYGFGNPGRKDDGLGITFGDKLEKWVRDSRIENIYFDTNYQLNIEDAYNISKYDAVFFVDASTEDIDSFKISVVEPSDKVNFSTHSVSPSFVAHLCGDIYGLIPDVFLIHIKGYEWHLEEGLSKLASHNLTKTLHFVKEIIVKKLNYTNKTRKKESLIQNPV